MKNRSLFIFGFVVLCVALVATLVFTSQSSATKLSGPQFLAKLAEAPHPILIDVRTPQEFASGHLASAINIDLENSSFAQEIANLDADTDYFVYCRSGNRSGKAVSAMQAAGLRSIYELRGGIVSNVDSITLITESESDVPYVVDASDLVDGQSLIAGSKKSTLSMSEKAGVIKMREEEKLARDVYTTLGQIWGMNVFSNIATSEQTHMNAMRTLVEKYSIQDPVTSDATGTFTAPAMQNLYDTLVAQGKKSRTDALIVGATIEDLDIHDIDILTKVTASEDILATYAQLQRGSRNHLRAFVKNIHASGSEYVPLYLQPDEYSIIINSPQEKGR